MRKQSATGLTKQNINNETIKMMTPLFLGGIGMQEILLIALIVLLFFGGRKIPELMKGIGKGVRSFKDGMSGLEKNLETDSSTIKEDKKK